MLALAFLYLGIGAWLGAVVFQSALVAPVVFGQLDAGGARSVLRALFPRFFLLGAACLATALIAALFLPVAPGARLLAAWMLVAALTMIVVARALVPAINRASDAGDAGRRRFGRLHGLSVLLTLGSLVAGLAVMAVVARALEHAVGSA